MRKSKYGLLGAATDLIGNISNQLKRLNAIFWTTLLLLLTLENIITHNTKNIHYYETITFLLIFSKHNIIYTK